MLRRIGKRALTDMLVESEGHVGSHVGLPGLDGVEDLHLLLDIGDQAPFRRDAGDASLDGLCSKRFQFAPRIRYFRERRQV